MCPPPQETDCVIIGVDGGATEVKAHAVACASLERPTSFELREETASRRYQRLPDFEPIPVAVQLAQRDAGNLELSAGEEAQGAEWITAAAEAVADVATACGGGHALVGMGMPGLKTAGGRGICVINNGPRLPHYLDQLERSLADRGVVLIAPVARLGSDADYCGLGELHAAEGLFRDIDNAYYVGCGTGIADAMKLGGRLVSFDEAREWIQKSWQMPSALGPTFEKLVSARSMNDCYARLLGCDGLSDARFPEVDAARGEPLALAWMDTVALVLADLIVERLRTIKNGRCEAPHRGPAYAALRVDHPFAGTCLDRVIIGQRIGQVYDDARFRAALADRLDAYVAAFIKQSGDTELTARYVDGDRLKPGFLRASRLRAAPALGAAVAAVQAYRGPQ